MSKHGIKPKWTTSETEDLAEVQSIDVLEPLGNETESCCSDDIKLLEDVLENFVGDVLRLRR